MWMGGQIGRCRMTIVPVNVFERTRLMIKDAWVGVGGVIRLKCECNASYDKRYG